MYDSTGNKVNFNKNSLSGYYYANGYTIQGSCNSGYTKVGDVKYTCNNGSWNSSGKCKPKVTVEYFSPYNNVVKSKEFTIGETVNCNNTTFGDPDNSGTKKLCRINGYIVAYEDQSFTAYKPTENNKSFCHGSYIPRDLVNNVDAEINTMNHLIRYYKNNSEYIINKSTYKNNIYNNNSDIKYSSSSGYTFKSEVSLKCVNGKWINSGYIEDCTSYITVPIGVSVVTLEVWGGEGREGRYWYMTFEEMEEIKGGKGGYSKGKYKITSDVDKLYIKRYGNNIGGYTTYITKNIEGDLTDDNVRNNTLIVAGGGGQGGGDSDRIGGDGGGLIGSDGKGKNPGIGGSQVEGGRPGTNYYSSDQYGSKGNGGYYNSYKSAGDGGNGWYGGGAGGRKKIGNSNNDFKIYIYGAGGGGSGYLSSELFDAVSITGGNETGEPRAKISW